MKCPSCAAPLAEPAAQCPRCKSSLRRLDQKFGALPKHHRYLTDRVHKLSPRETAETHRLLDYFEAKFTHSLFSVYLADLPARTSISEYHFWLFNRGRFDVAESNNSQNFNVLLLIDVTAGAVALGVGYGLEPYLGEHDLRLILEEAQPAFVREDWARAMQICIEATLARMREIARHVQTGAAPLRAGTPRTGGIAAAVASPDSLP